MIIFNLIVVFNVNVSLFWGFLTPLCIFFWILVNDLIFIIFYFFYLFFFPYFFVGVVWVGLVVIWWEQIKNRGLLEDPTQMGG